MSYITCIMWFTQLTDEYHEYSERQLSFDNHRFQNPSVYNISLRTVSSPVTEIRSTTSPSRSTKKETIKICPLCICNSFIHEHLFCHSTDINVK